VRPACITEGYIYLVLAVRCWPPKIRTQLAHKALHFDYYLVFRLFRKPQDIFTFRFYCYYNRPFIHIRGGCSCFPVDRGALTENTGAILKRIAKANRPSPLCILFQHATGGLNGIHLGQFTFICFSIYIVSNRRLDCQ
jgi:hypothetical protein